MCDVSLNPILAGSSNYNGLSKRDQDTIHEMNFYSMFWSSVGSTDRISDEREI